MAKVKLQQQKYYELWYWGYYDRLPECTQLLVKPVVVPPETREQMLSNKSNVRYYRFIVDDGEEMLVVRDCVHSLHQIYGKGGA